MHRVTVLQKIYDVGAMNTVKDDVTKIVKDLVIADGVDYDGFDHQAHTYPPCRVCGRGWAGVASAPGKWSALNGLVNHKTMEHEWGHNRGLIHSGFADEQVREVVERRERSDRRTNGGREGAMGV